MVRLISMKHALKCLLIVIALMVFCASAAIARAEDSPKETPKDPPSVTDAIVVTADTSDQLIYSVDRVPERPFDTSRADTVITSAEIRQANKTGLADLLEEQAGIVISSRPSGGTPIIRGLSDKQVMILIDGIKVNNATWGGTDIVEYLNLIALEQIERIEIVRGVVSVLGTESLGGVINIITKKGPPAGETIGGSITARYGSGDSSFSAPLELYGRTNNFRFNAGLSRGNYGDIRSPGETAQQPSGYHQFDAYANGQLLLTHEKSLSFGYQNVRQNNVEWPASPGLVAARDLILGNLAYQDLTSRSWEDSIRVTGFVNRQEHTADLTGAGFAPFHFFDNDALRGTNIELGKFIGSHHFVGGFDYSSDKIRSWAFGPDFVTGQEILQRGTEMDQARYSAAAGYLQDRFDPSKWLTVIAGVRYGRFSTSGHETTILGPSSLDGHHGDVTGALNLVAHLTPALNVIANVFRGFRAPNLDDVSRAGFKTSNGVFGYFGYEITNPSAQAEHVMSYETGLKFDNGRVQASAFVYRNKLSDLLAVTRVGYLDFNVNGIQDPGEFDLLQNLNVGRAKVSGYELQARWALPINSVIWAHYAQTTGTNTVTGEPLSLIPGGYGALGYRYAPPLAHSPWAELLWRHQGNQDRLNAADRANPLYASGIPGFDVVNLRFGMVVVHRVSAALGIENLFNEKYREIGAPLDGAARQVVITTRYTF